ILVAGNVTLAAGVSLHGTTGTLSIGSGALVNQGTIAADGGGTIYFQPSSGTSWTNAAGGVIEAEAGGSLTISGAGVTGLNAAGGLLKADGGSTLTLGTAWSNAGTIAVTNSTLNLGGTFTTAGLGSYARNGGVINLTGSLDNSGTTLVLDGATGSWNLAGG